jgi:hypothetical protein
VTVRALIHIGPLEPVGWHFLLTFWALRQIKRIDLVFNLGLDMLKFLLKMFKVTRQHFAPRNERRQRIDVNADDLSAEAKPFNYCNAASAKWVKNDASGIGVVFDKRPKHAPWTPGKIPVHLVNRRMGLGDHRVVDWFQVVQILQVVGQFFRHWNKTSRIRGNSIDGGIVNEGRKGSKAD